MEFSYTISEEEFLTSCGALGRANCPVIKTALRWALIMGTAILVWAALAHMTTPPSEEETGSPYAWRTFFPFLVVLNLWFGLGLFTGRKRRLRAAYRKDPTQQGRFTVDVTPEFIKVSSSAEFSDQSKWNIYEYWIEARELIIVVFRSGAYRILPLTALTEPQRVELRGILGSVLPKK